MRNLVLFLAISPLTLCAQSVSKAIEKGNALYRQQQFVQAAEEYRKAIQADPANKEARFNLANAIYKQDNKVQAAELLNGLSKDVQEKGLLSKIYYNKGVILSRQKNLEASIDAYKNALRNNPDDKEARENLQKALEELKKKSPPPPKKEDKKKKQPQQQQQKQPQSKLNPKETERQLKLLEQKEKEVQQRVQSERSKTGGDSRKDW